MPIYAYKCESCGHRQDVLQKVSDPVLTICPACSAASFAKQVTAAGFQLKGTGWYATDFRGGSKPAEAAADKAESKPDAAGVSGSDTAAPAQAAPAAAAPATPKTGPAAADPA